jgi:hypothetical protein
MVTSLSVSKRFLVVDAWVIGKASERANDELVWKAVDVLSRILHVCHKVVIDPRDPRLDTVLDEYERQATSDITKKWIIAIQTRQDKVTVRPRANVNMAALSDPDDLKYFQVAVNSPHHIIISEDSDITSIADNPEVVNRGIQIWRLDDALRNL